jgi:hypothetical protein
MDDPDVEEQRAWQVLELAFKGVLDLHLITHMNDTNWAAERLYDEAILAYRQALGEYIQAQVRLVLATDREEAK